MRRLSYLAVAVCILAVFALRLVALLSPGGGTSQQSAVCVSPPEPPPVSARLTVVPNAVKPAPPGTNYNIVQAGMVLCRAGLNQTLQKAPAAQPGGNGVWTVVSQWPAAGSHIPVGSDVMLTGSEVVSIRAS